MIFLCAKCNKIGIYFQDPLGRSRQNLESMKAKKRVVKLITIVILIFTICWLPLQVKRGATPKRQMK